MPKFSRLLPKEIKPLNFETQLKFDSSILCVISQSFSWKHPVSFNMCWTFQQCQYEPRHDKTNKMSVRPAKTQISLDIHPVWSVFAVRMKKALVLSYPLSVQWRLIRLGGCPDWSESSLGAHLFCWFCHVANQMIGNQTSLLLKFVDHSRKWFNKSET